MTSSPRVPLTSGTSPRVDAEQQRDGDDGRRTESAFDDECSCSQSDESCSFPFPCSGSGPGSWSVRVATAAVV